MGSTSRNKVTKRQTSDISTDISDINTDITTINDYIYRPGSVIECLTSPCDGSVISLLSGDYTVQEVTERYIPSSVAHTALTGSSLTYTPPCWH